MNSKSFTYATEFNVAISYLNNILYDFQFEENPKSISPSEYKSSARTCLKKM